MGYFQPQCQAKLVLSEYHLLSCQTMLWFNYILVDLHLDPFSANIDHRA